MTSSGSIQLWIFIKKYFFLSFISYFFLSFISYFFLSFISYFLFLILKKSFLDYHVSTRLTMKTWNNIALIWCDVSVWVVVVSQRYCWQPNGISSENEWIKFSLCYVSFHLMYHCYDIFVLFLITIFMLIDILLRLCELFDVDSLIHVNSMRLFVCWHFIELVFVMLFDYFIYLIFIPFDILSDGNYNFIKWFPDLIL